MLLEVKSLELTLEVALSKVGQTTREIALSMLQFA